MKVWKVQKICKMPQKGRSVSTFKSFDNSESSANGRFEKWRIREISQIFRKKTEMFKCKNLSN